MLIFAAQAGAAAFVYALLVALLYRFPSAGVGLVLGVFVAEAVAISFSSLGLGSIDAYPQDIVFVALGGAGAARLLFRGRLSLLQLVWLLFGALVVLSFVRGVGLFGVNLAGVEVREYVYLFAGVLYFMTVPADPRFLRRLVTLWVFVAGVLLSLTLLRWALIGLGLSGGAQWAPTAGVSSLRVLDSAQTLFLAQALLIGLYLWLVPGSSLVWRSLAGLLLPAVVLLQHRTVWIATAVALALVFLFERRLRGLVLPVLAGSALAGMVMALFLFAGDANIVTQSLEASAAEAVNTENSTFLWRLESWRVLLGGDYLSGYVEYLIGRPFGAGYERYMPSLGMEINVSPHNFFIQTLLRTGALGLALLIGVYVLLFLRLRRLRFQGMGERFSPRLALVLLVTQVVYSLSYPLNYEQGILLGIAAGAFWFAPRERTRKRRRVRVVWKTPA